MTARPLDLSDRALREGLATCLAVPRWVDDVVAGAPYADLDDLLDAAGVAATPEAERCHRIAGVRDRNLTVPARATPP